MGKEVGNMDLGLNIKLLRLERKLSQGDLSNILGISQTSIAHYEKGTRQPAIETLIQLSQLFNVTIESLLGIEKSLKEAVSINDIQKQLPLMQLYLINKQEDEFVSFFKDKVENQFDLEVILSKILQPILYEIGSLWEKGKISEEDEHYATNAIRKILHHLSHTQSSKIKSKSVLSYAISAEKHTIGLEMLNVLLQHHNIKTIYLGTNVSNTGVKEIINKEKPDAVLISVTLDSYLNNLSHHVRDLVKQFGNEINIYIGGQGVLHNEYTLDYKNVHIIRDNNSLINELRPNYLF